MAQHGEDVTGVIRGFDRLRLSASLRSTHGVEQVIGRDSGYANEIFKTHCRQAGVTYLVNDKAHRNRPLSSTQKRTNRKKSSVRGKVKFPFWIIKQL